MTDATFLSNNLEGVLCLVIDARKVSARTWQCGFFGVSALIFAASQPPGIAILSEEGYHDR